MLKLLLNRRLYLPSLPRCVSLTAIAQTEDCTLIFAQMCVTYSTSVKTFEGVSSLLNFLRVLHSLTRLLFRICIPLVGKDVLRNMSPLVAIM